ncbi:hypothetical protein B0H16DRAFT_414590 [Mycena metata]|uniref:Uncharacterized protein n=1 Tax=Mycena metata TaxID=1033252 RepID=A0AAD7JJG5_9AGAR|nr:hypothetical protein B0H16DRAFT_414590 [Mycena metata]
MRIALRPSATVSSSISSRPVRSWCSRAHALRARPQRDTTPSILRKYSHPPAKGYHAICPPAAEQQLCASSRSVSRANPTYLYRPTRTVSPSARARPQTTPRVPLYFGLDQRMRRASTPPIRIPNPRANARHSRKPAYVVLIHAFHGHAHAYLLPTCRPRANCLIFKPATRTNT